MDERRSNVAKQTRAQKDRLKKMQKRQDDYLEKKQREESHDDFQALDAEEKRREELGPNEVKKSRCKNVVISSDSSDDKKRGLGFNSKLFHRKRRGTVKKGKTVCIADNEGSGSDVEILREEEKKKDVKRDKKSCDDHERSRNYAVILRGEEMGKGVNPNEGRRETVKKGKKRYYDDQKSGSDAQIMREIKEGEDVNSKKSNKRGRKTVKEDQNGCGDDEGSGSDAVILSEECVPLGWRRDHVKSRKHFPLRGKRGRSDGTRTNERMRSGVSGGAQEKGKDAMIENHTLESEASSSKDENGDSDYNNDLDSNIVENNAIKNDRENDIEDSSIVGKNAVNNDNGGSYYQRDDEAARSRLLTLRPRSRMTPESRKKELRLRASTNSSPLVSESEDFDSDEDSCCSDHVTEHGRKDSVKVEKLPRRKTMMSQMVNYLNIFLDSMLKEDDQLEETLSLFEEKTPTQDALPLKFRFEDEDPAPPEKDDWQKQVDNLFAEMEMCLTLPDTDSNILSMAGSVDVITKTKTPAERCLLGEHMLVLEEPIGIICKCCQIVYMEMKYIFPDLKKETSGRRDWVKFQKGDLPTVDELHFGDSRGENYYNSVRGEGSVLDLIPDDIRMSMYCHQLDGFIFLWKNIGGETYIEKMKTKLPDDGRGCIISHAPGTGKTCLTIVFIMSFLEMYSMCRPVIIAPKSMLLTWEEEFRKWGFRIPFHNFNSQDFSGKEIETDADILRKVGRRMTKLYSWMNQRSVLGISYKLFEQLVNGRKGQRSNERIGKILLQRPGLLILDEGHTPRNNQSLLWKVLTQVKTKRKIILSGTPFQNNFDELFNTLCLVNPKLSGSITSEGQRKSNVDREKWFSLTNAIDNKSDSAIEELKAMIDPFVHVHKGSILEECLPGLKDTLVILQPTDHQKNVFELIPDDCSGFDRVHLVSLISVHPSLAALNKRFSIHKDRLAVLKCNPHAGVKTKFTLELIRLCDTLREKVLVFSEYIDPLKFIMMQLTDQLNWREGKEMLYMDGKRDEKERQSSINSLNDSSSEVKVFFASIRAFSEGINLVGASRVVLLDVVWNPSVERQAICRAYRLGQKKIVYVYHLITFGTLEVEKYVRQVNKDRLSELVFSDPDRQNKKFENSSIVKEDKILEAMLHNKMLKDIFENIVHQPKESNVFANFNYVEHKD